MGSTIMGIVRSLITGLQWIWDTFIMGTYEIAGFEINAGMLIGATALSIVAAIAVFKIIF